MEEDLSLNIRTQYFLQSINLPGTHQEAAEAVEKIVPLIAENSSSS